MSRLSHLCLASFRLALLGVGVVVTMGAGSANVAAAAGVDQSVDFEQSSYFQVTRLDPRLCPAPACGGVFVKLVNRYGFFCADGARAKECHAAIVDWSALGLTPAEEVAANADFIAKRVLVRGSLELVDAGLGIPIPTLVVSDAWRGVTGAEAASGRYFGVVSSGIVCIASPCPSLIQLRLNRRGIRYLHSLDLLEASDATNEEIGQGLEALYSADGLIVFATMRRISGPAGHGRELVSSEFYTKLAGRDDQEGPVPPPSICGPTTCESGFVCCNPVMGICTLPGMFCIQ